MTSKPKQIINVNMTCTAVLLSDTLAMLRFLEPTTNTIVWWQCDRKELWHTKILKDVPCSGAGRETNILGSKFAILMNRNYRNRKNIMANLDFDHIIKIAPGDADSKANNGYWAYDATSGQHIVGDSIDMPWFIKQAIVNGDPLYSTVPSDKKKKKSKFVILPKRQILVTRHAINRASTRILKRYMRFHGPGEGLVDYLIRMTKKALAENDVAKHENGTTTYRYKGMRLAVSQPSPNVFQLVTVMRDRPHASWMVKQLRSAKRWLTDLMTRKPAVTGSVPEPVLVEEIAKPDGAAKSLDSIKTPPKEMQ